LEIAAWRVWSSSWYWRSARRTSSRFCSRIVRQSWGSLAAVIITLTWLWLSALALLLGAEVDAEVERVCRGDDVPAQAGAE